MYTDIASIVEGMDEVLDPKQRDSLGYDTLKKYMNQGNSAIKIAEQGGVGNILKGMEENIHNINTSFFGMVLLRYFNIRLNIRLNKEKIVEGGGIQVVIDTLCESKDFDTDHRGISILFDLARNNDEVKAKIVDANGLPMLRDKLYSNVADHGTVRDILELILLLICNNHENRNKMISDRGIQALQYILKKYLVSRNRDRDDHLYHERATIQKLGCKALMYLSEINVKEIYYKSADITMLNSMEKYPNIQSIQRCGCKVAMLITNLDGHHRKNMDQRIERIIFAMEKYLDDIFIQYYGFNALKKLSQYRSRREKIVSQQGIVVMIRVMETLVNQCQDRESRKEFVSHRGIEVLLQSMKKYSDNATIQANGCMILHYIANNGVNIPKIADTGGIVTIISAMKKHITEPQVQIFGCGVLKVLALNSDIKKTIASMDGIETIIASMKRYIYMDEVQKWGCGALWKLCLKNEDNQKILVNACGIVAIVDAIKKYTNNILIIQWGYKALYILATNQNYKSKIVDCGGDKAVMKGMNAHPNSKEVQSNGDRALKALLGRKRKRKWDIEMVLDRCVNKVVKMTKTESA